MLEVSLEVLLRLDLVAEPAQGRHDAGILIHPAEFAAMVDAEPFGLQAAGLKGRDQDDATCRIMASSFVKSIGFVMCVMNPAARLRWMSSSMP